MKRRFRSIKRNRRLIGFVACASGQMNLSRVALVDSSEDQQWLLQEKVRWTLRVHIRHFNAFERQLDVGQHRALDAGKEVRHLLTDFSYVGDGGESTAPELRHLGSKEKIGRASNRNRVQTRIAQMATQRCENFLFVAQVAGR